MSARKLAATLLGNILDPGLCPGCRHALEPPQLFCSLCHQRLLSITNPCQLCGLENHNDGTICATCLYDPPRWQHLIAPWQYRGFTRELLLMLKFSESLHLANSLVSIATEYFIQPNNPPEALLPVPLHQNRLIHRGFNQAYEIARIMSSQLNIKLDNNTLTRIRDTEAQAGLSATGREKNILKAFSCQNDKHYRHVAVVDDIITTGSTANEITRTLHRAGVETVEIWGLARVVKY